MNNEKDPTHRTHRLSGVALVVGDRRILRGVVLRAVLAIVLRGVLAAVLLWIVTLLHFLPVTSQRGPDRRWGVLARVTLLLDR